MSRPIRFAIRLAILGAALFVSGCAGGLPGAGGAQRTVVLDRAIQLTAPGGYCVDPQISRPARGFAFLAACAVIDPRAEVAPPAALAIVTVQAGAAGGATVGGAERDFRDFLRTEQGRTLLAAGDMGGPIEILTTDVEPNRVRVYTRDLTPPVIRGTQAESWRAFTDVAGRTVTVTVRGLADEPLSQTRGRSLLDAALGNLTAIAQRPAS
ncbi:dihydroxy-acid dehydratase [Salipiger sp. IMCC34102]|uniref:dihydroxy-acid dehydratase n=1 Tax=Salipiger sp. IMCC34102 TaxID=2510647 RepID=UPI00101BDED3|nr:dihydroxy-acid dehydratase [Salipiger sp. IMCC34102]RYH01973.1 dihydroxy-acid dehydratase [Salipiger sp. IMCC34102]